MSIYYYHLKKKKTLEQQKTKGMAVVNKAFALKRVQTMA